MKKKSTPSVIPKRDLDKGSLLTTFARDVLAVCPKCRGPVRVTCESRNAIPFVPRNARAVCTRCSFVRMQGENEFLRVQIRLHTRQCPKCGSDWIENAIAKNRRILDRGHQLGITCGSCGLYKVFPIR